MCGDFFVSKLYVNYFVFIFDVTVDINDENLDYYLGFIHLIILWYIQTI